VRNLLSSGLIDLKLKQNSSAARLLMLSVYIFSCILRALLGHGIRYSGMEGGIQDIPILMLASVYILVSRKFSQKRNILLNAYLVLCTSKVAKGTYVIHLTHVDLPSYSVGADAGCYDGLIFLTVPSDFG
jgi:hypothetical protein